jgi:hypothetical protein
MTRRFRLKKALCFFTSFVAKLGKNVTANSQFALEQIKEKLFYPQITQITQIFGIGN